MGVQGSLRPVGSNGIYPQTYDFGESAVTRGDYVVGYRRIGPWGVGALAIEGATGFAMIGDAGDLHAGYFGSAGAGQDFIGDQFRVLVDDRTGFQVGETIRDGAGPGQDTGKEGTIVALPGSPSNAIDYVRRGLVFQNGDTIHGVTSSASTTLTSGPISSGQVVSLINPPAVSWTTTPPVEPANPDDRPIRGTRWLVWSAAGMGVFAGQENKIAIYVDDQKATTDVTAWEFIDPASPPAGQPWDAVAGNDWVIYVGQTQLPANDDGIGRYLIWRQATPGWVQFDIGETGGLGPFTVGVGDRFAVSFTARTTPDLLPDICHYAYTHADVQDVEVVGSVFLHGYTGHTPHPESFTYAGLGARIQGGTHVAATGGYPAYTNAPDGYFCYLQVGEELAGNTPARWTLVRAKAGVLTVLNQSNEFNLGTTIGDLYAPGPTPTGMNPNQLVFPMNVPKRIRMTVTGTNPVQIRVYVSSPLNVQGAPYGPGNPDWASGLVLIANDSDADRIQGAGACGLQSARARPISGVTTNGDFRIAWSFFQVKNTATGDVLLRDEWERVRYDYGDTAQNAGLEGNSGVAAYGLRSVFAGDGASSTLFRHFLEHIGSDTTVAINDGDDLNLGGYHVVATPPASNYTQRRRLRFHFPGGQTGFNYAGVFIRGSIGGTPSNLAQPSGPTGAGVDFKNAYLLALLHTGDGSTFLLNLLGLSVAQNPPNGGLQLLAQKDISLEAGVGLFPTVMSIDLQAVNQGGVDESSGVPNLVVRLNDVAVVMENPAAGIIVEDNGLIRDTRAPGLAHLGGQMVGPYTVPASGQSVVVYEFEARDAENIPGGPDPPDPPTPENDQPSIGGITNELDGKFGELVVPHGWPVRLQAGFEVNVRKFDSGHIQRHLRYPRGRRVWTVSAQNFTDSDLDALKAFWDSHRGTELGFDWRPPHPDDLTLAAVHFMDEELGRTLQSGSASGGYVGDFQFRLEELLG